MRMQRNLRIVVWAVFVAVCNASDAHHAPYIYDLEQERVVIGRVTEFEWTQPHTWTRISVRTSDGSEAILSLEGMNPAVLGRRGWNRHTFRAGDVIEVAYFPRKDGAAEGMLIRARLPDGSMKVMAVLPKSE